MTVLMSFLPNIYKQILNQVKLVEYRRNFPKNCSYAFMYISRPTQAICGIIYFGTSHRLEDWKRVYSYNKELINKIDSYLEKYRFATEIIAIQKIEPISLENIRKNIPHFNPPQSYFILENNIPLKTYIENNIKHVDMKITNNLENIFPKHVCKKY